MVAVTIFSNKMVVKVGEVEYFTVPNPYPYDYEREIQYPRWSITQIWE